eukprot:4769110-Prymnesium_polylepis.1
MRWGASKCIGSCADDSAASLLMSSDVGGHAALAQRDQPDGRGFWRRAAALLRATDAAGSREP